MSIPILNNLNLNNNQLLSALLEVLASNPGVGPEGRLLYNSVTKKIQWHNGTTYVGPYFDTTRLDQITAPTASVSLNSQKITNLLDGTANQDAASWGQVQSLIQGVRWLGARAASTANVTIPPGGTTLTVDTVSLANGEVVLLKNQTAPAENGPYVVSGIGSSVVLTRTPEMNTAAEVDGKVFIIEDGTQAGTMWITISEVTTLGTDPIVFTQFNSATDIVAGAGLTRTGTTLDVNVDNSSIEINADILRVKALGIVNSMIAAGTIDLTTKVTGLLPVLNGGTGSSSAAGARTNLGAVGKFSADITGDGTTTSFPITHSFGTKDIHVQVWEATSDLEVFVDKVRTSTNVVTINFSVAPVVSKVYRVVVMG